MSWLAISLSLRLRGDIHCGYLPLGFVARTFPFVPCHVPFFAMIPPVVEGLSMPSEHTSYKAVERLFTSCLRSTPLFIRDGKGVLFPWCSNHLRTLEADYLGSRYGVMLENSGRTAQEGHLYETEVILATKRGSTEPTRLEGALFFRAHSLDELVMTDEGIVIYCGRSMTLADIIARMRLGGDRTRALGLPATASIEPLNGMLWEKYRIYCDEEWPVLEVLKEECGPLPLALKGAGEIEGLPMLLTGRRYTKRGAGMSMDVADAAYRFGWKGKDQDIRIALALPRCAMRHA